MGLRVEIADDVLQKFPDLTVLVRELSGVSVSDSIGTEDRTRTVWCGRRDSNR
jgi:hypothetical protein